MRSSKKMELFELHQKNILDKKEIGQLLEAGIEIVDEEKLAEIEEEEILEEEVVENIKKEIAVDQEDNLLEKAEEYLQKKVQKPKETLTDSEGNFSGFRFQVNERIGSVTYHDVHVRISKKDATVYFGSLWYTDDENNTRRFNFEMRNDGKISYSKRIGSRYYRQVIELTERVIDYFEEEIEDKVGEMPFRNKENNKEDKVDEEKIEAAVAQAKEKVNG